MKLALCNEVIRELPFAEQCAFAAALGYDGLELAPFTIGEEPQNLPAQAVREIRRAAERAGIPITGLHWLLVAPAGLSITSPDPDVGGRTREVLLSLVRLCAELGGYYVVHGSPQQRALAPGDEQEGRKRAIEILAAAAEAAEENGIVYCLEALSPQQDNFVTSIAAAQEVISQIGSGAFRTMIDCAAAAQGEREDIPTLIARHVPDGMIGHVHFNDPNRRGPGQGSLQFAPIIKALKETQYDGWVGVEPFVYEPDGPACAARAIGYVRGLEEAAGRG
jgi:D-psicose/D-tagatose/L-ribulose 3-epimerase